MPDEPFHVGPHEGIRFAHGDYAGLGKRVLVILLDGAVLVVAAVLFYIASDDADPWTGWDQRAALLWGGFAFWYLVLLKPIPGYTLGFWATGLRIVDFRGRRPSPWRMLFREAIWFLGPINALVDLFWLGGDSRRQTLRDKFASTYVVRRHAEPIGVGRRKAVYYTLLMMSLAFWEIQDEPASPVPESPGLPN